MKVGVVCSTLFLCGVTIFPIKVEGVAKNACISRVDPSIKGVSWRSNECGRVISGAVSSLIRS